MKNNVLVGVSGGPDSMYLLYTLYKKRNLKTIVVHVNYNYRKESKKEVEIVRNFCSLNNLELYVLDVNDEILERYSRFKNIQSKSREIRYDFYKEISVKKDTNILYLGHHKDDFIETAIMQEDRSKKLLFYGIEKRSLNKGLIIKRPLIKEYKDDLISSLVKNKISFAIDKSNFDPKYERNRIRINLSSKTKKEKNKIYKHYKMINNSKSLERKKVFKNYDDWKESDFDRKMFLKFEEDTQINLIYKFLISSSKRVKINSNKINGIIDFIKSNKGISYRISDYFILTCNNSKIKLIEK